AQADLAAERPSGAISIALPDDAKTPPNEFGAKGRSAGRPPAWTRWSAQADLAAERPSGAISIAP
ncbi:MAG: hypothetical protein WA077_19055, partial [Anaerolineae bacterium]